MAQYEVRHQCDPKRCVECDHFYRDSKSGVYCCSAGHDELVGRYADACCYFKPDRYYERADKT